MALPQYESPRLQGVYELFPHLVDDSIYCRGSGEVASVSHPDGAEFIKGGKQIPSLKTKNSNRDVPNITPKYLHQTFMLSKISNFIPSDDLGTKREKLR